jgi:RNA polymerase sigma factor (sigma-70 family)
MASRTAAALKKVIQSVASTDHPVVTDRELLGRFVREDDQGAFTTLVGRHSEMVLGVCRRVLAHAHDAEDACQASFLVLSQKAKSIRWQVSIANWLYTTARQVAHNARVAGERRARRERKAAVQETVLPVDRMTGRELLAALDEELDKLPPRFREPLVLCYLEGLTRDETAARLGVLPTTVKSRLEQGRKRLHDALTQSGVTLGAALLTLAATSPARASSPRLIQAVLAAMSGSAPTAVVELAKGITMKALMNKTVLALAATIGVVALGIGWSSMSPRAEGQPPEKPVEKVQGKDTKPAADALKEVVVSGRVLDPDGKPLAAANLSLLDKVEEPVKLGATDADGRFKVKVPVTRRAMSLVAQKEGLGVGFVDLSRNDLAQEIEFRTVKDNPIRGKVVDTEGKPIAGAKVLVTNVGTYPNDSLDSFLAEWKTRPPRSRPPVATRMLVREMGVFPATTTDATGRFTVAGCGSERVVTLRIRGDGIADSELMVVNRAGFDPEPYNKATADKMAAKPIRLPEFRQILSGPESSVVVEAEKVIRGTIQDAETGKPQVGVKVWVTRDGGESPLLVLNATTDAEGRYEIRGARKQKSYALEIPSDPVAAHVAARVQVVDTAGYEPVVADVKVKKGVIVTGKVIDATTKEVLPGLVMTAVLADNPFAKEYPDLGLATWLNGQPTGEDGTFRVVAIPGPVLLMGGPDFRRLSDGEAAANRYKRAVPDPNYPQYFDKGGRVYHAGSNALGLIQGHFCKVIEIKPDAKVVTQDLLVERIE